MFSKEKFASILREARFSAGLTQSQLAEKVNVNRTAITLLERGERAPSVEVLCALSEVLQVTVDYLVGKSDLPDYTESEAAVLMPKFPARLKALREARNLDVFDMAPLVGETPRNYAGYESGEAFPRYKTLLAIADYFDVSLDYLCGRSDEPTN